MRRGIFLVIAWLSFVAVARAQSEMEADKLAFFETKVRPVLAEHCYACHRDEPKKHKGGLALDTQAGWQTGGDSGPAVLPGKANDSLLVKAIRYDDPDLRMPPKGKLPAAVIADLEKWVTLGAPWGKDEGGRRKEASVRPTLSWAFQAPKATPVPAVKDAAWPRGSIDRYLLARLESAGLRPARDADRATLLRRATFALVGLPPTPAEIDAFANDPSPEAFVKVVDDLLSRPQFGERWGRHWLDVARFAESSGGGRSLLFEDAWRYRDYVIDAFNRDKPFDQFVREQVAGDLLPAATPEQRRDQLVATALLLLGPINYEEQDKPQLEMDIVDEQLDTLGRAFLGMTIGCARCHDHKFDPIPTRDYYALAGILRSTHVVQHDNVSRWVEQALPTTPGQGRAIAAHAAEVAALKARLRQAKESTNRTTLEAALKRLVARAPERPMAMAVSDAATIEDCAIRIRGNVHNRGPTAPRGFLSALTPSHTRPHISAHESGRRQLADWLASPDNPQTARVAVNRLWHHLFGFGLVRSVDNFGSTGEPPSHPELLDHLARQFVADGWSIKRMIRTLMLSRAYRMTTEADPATARRAARVDPENRLLWHMNRQRLEAEAIRDAMLCVSGELVLTAGSVRLGKKTVERDYKFDDTRRSVYTPVFRNKLPELFEVFDFANPNTCLGSRNVSTVAPQALYLMNSPFVMERAHAAAKKLAAADLDDAGRIERAYRLALGRVPSATERRLALAYVARGGSSAWESFVQALFGTLDFRYVH